MRDWKLESLANGKEISPIPFRTEKEDYLWRKSTISKRIFQKITVPFDFQPKFPNIFGRWKASKEMEAKPQTISALHWLLG